MGTHTETSDPIGPAIARAWQRTLWPEQAARQSHQGRRTWRIKSRAIGAGRCFGFERPGWGRGGTRPYRAKTHNDAGMPGAVEPGDGERDFGWLLFLGWLHKPAAQQARLIGVVNGDGEGLFVPVTDQKSLRTDSHFDPEIV